MARYRPGRLVRRHFPIIGKPYTIEQVATQFEDLAGGQVFIWSVVDTTVLDPSAYNWREVARFDSRLKAEEHVEKLVRC